MNHAKKIARKDRHVFPRWLAGCFAALILLSTARGASFTASLDRDTIVLGENVTLTLTFDGVSPGGVPQLPTIPGLQVGGGVSSSFNTTIGVDGHPHNVQSISLPLIANQIGEFQIPALQISIDGQKYSSAPLKLKVLREDPTAPPADLGGKSAFLWLALPKPEVYVGEPFVAELRLYVREGLDFSNVQLAPLSGEGFNAGKYVQGQQFQRKVGQTSFTVLPVFFPLTPVKSGPLTLGPINGSVVIHFGPTDFFGRHTQRQQITLTVEPRSLQALPLPSENVPANFNGAIGSYSMKVTAGPTNVATGDPITVRVQISGRGALSALTLPEQPAWQNFKIYPPTANLESTDTLGLQGMKTFEQIVSAETPDIKALPAFSFSFFDPDAKAYRTLTQPALPLTVRPGGTSPAPVIAFGKNSAPDTPPPQQDIVPLKQRPGTLAQIRPPLVRQPWFIALQSVPVLAWLAAVGWRKRADALANNPRRRRQQRVAQIIRDGLGDLRQHATTNQAGDFFATLVRLLQEQLGERLDCPASSITEAVIEEKLRPRGVAEDTLTALHELFQTCNLARYAPLQTSQELAALIPKVETTLRKLQNIRA